MPRPRDRSHCFKSAFIGRRRCVLERPSRPFGGASGRGRRGGAHLSKTKGYSPYGVQMFFTWVARRRNSRPSAWGQSRVVEAVQVGLRLPAEAASTFAAPAASPTYQSASTPSCSASVVRERVGFAGDDVDDAGRNVRGVEHRIEVGRAQGMRGGGDGDDAVAHRDRRHDQRHEGEQRRFVGADDAHHAPGLVHRERDEAGARRVHRAVVFVGEAGVEESALDRGVDLAAAAREEAPVIVARRFGEFVGPRGRDSRRRSRAPARDCAPSPRPSRTPCAAASTALRMSLRLPRPASPTSPPLGSSTA